MGQAQLYPDRIRRLKERKEKLNLSCQAITDLVTDANGITSLATVKKVFSASAENKKFKDITLQPIEKALGLLDEMSPPSMSKSTEEFYQNAIKELNLQLKEARATLQIRNAAIIFLALMISAILIYDRTNLDIGFYRPDSTTGWVMITVIFVCFCIVAVTYLFTTRKKSLEDHEQSEL